MVLSSLDWRGYFCLKNWKLSVLGFVCHHHFGLDCYYRLLKLKPSYIRGKVNQVCYFGTFFNFPHIIFRVFPFTGYILICFLVKIPLDVGNVYFVFIWKRSWIVLESDTEITSLVKKINFPSGFSPQMGILVLFKELHQTDKPNKVYFNILYCCS